MISNAKIKRPIKTKHKSLKLKIKVQAQNNMFSPYFHESHIVSILLLLELKSNTTTYYFELGILIRDRLKF